MKVPIHTLDGKKIDPKHATPKNRPKTANKTKKIFVGGVSQDTSVDEVKAYFSQFGKVEEAVMLMDQQTKRHRGFGFVSLADGEKFFHNIKLKLDKLIKLFSNIFQRTLSTKSAKFTFTPLKTRRLNARKLNQKRLLHQLHNFNCKNVYY